MEIRAVYVLKIVVGYCEEEVFDSRHAVLRQGELDVAFELRKVQIVLATQPRFSFDDDGFVGEVNP